MDFATADGKLFSCSCERGRSLLSTRRIESFSASKSNLTRRITDENCKLQAWGSLCAASTTINVLSLSLSRERAVSEGGELGFSLRMVHLSTEGGDPPRIGTSSASSPLVHPEPARRRLHPSPTAHPWKAASAWAQQELLQSSTGTGHATTSHTGSQMPRVCQPLRVEPPAEYNAPPRVQILRGSGKRGAEQEHAVLTTSHPPSHLNSPPLIPPLLLPPSTRAEPLLPST